MKQIKMENTEKYNQRGWKGPSLKICIKKNKINKNKNRNGTLLVQTSLSGSMAEYLGRLSLRSHKWVSFIHGKVVHECQLLDRCYIFTGPKVTVYPINKKYFCFDNWLKMWGLCVIQPQGGLLYSPVQI